MQVSHRVENLFEDVYNLSLVQKFLASKLKQIPVLHVLQHYIQLVAVLERGIQLDYVGVLEEFLNLQFSVQSIPLLVGHLGKIYLIKKLFSRRIAVLFDDACKASPPRYSLRPNSSNSLSPGPLSRVSHAGWFS